MALRNVFDATNKGQPQATHHHSLAPEEILPSLPGLHPWSLSAPKTTPSCTAPASAPASPATAAPTPVLEIAAFKFAPLPVLHFVVEVLS